MKKVSLFDWLFMNKPLPTITLMVLLLAFVYFGAGLLIAFAPEIKAFTQSIDQAVFGRTMTEILK